MPEIPSPRAVRLAAPGWLDPRLVAGVLLVLVSVVVGAKVVSDADEYEQVWAARLDLAAGTVLACGDLTVRRVRFYGNGRRYLAARADPAGFVLARAVGADEFIARAALRPPGTATSLRLVTLPVQRHHVPVALGHGSIVDLYVTPKPQGGEPNGPSQLVLPRAVVASIDEGGGRFGAGSDLGVVLQVPEGKVAAVVAAAQRGALDLVRVPTGADGTAVPGGSPGGRGEQGG
ncbi:MAG: hypothetical protein ACM3ZF_08740 [Mycobacterium leprae]